MAFFYDGISLQNGRSVNMDSLLLDSWQVGDEELCLAAVCDGVGSLTDGAFAASSAARSRLMTSSIAGTRTAAIWKLSTTAALCAAVPQKTGAFCSKSRARLWKLI